WLTDNDITVPVWIVLQLSTEMMLTECEWGCIAVLVIGDFTFETHIIEVRRNHQAERRLIGAVNKFWSDIEAGVEPKIDYERDGDLLALLYPSEIPGKVVDLRGDNRVPELLDSLDKLEKIKSASEKEIASIRNELRDKLKDAEEGLIMGWRLTNKLQHREGYTASATSYRVLRHKRERI